jgi:hypothetical protein
MSQTEPETVQCKFCGEVNEVGSALCANCKSPLTAYAGEIKGLSAEEKARMAARVARLKRHPPAVYALTVFNALFALFWPLAFTLGGFMARERVNSEGTNYLAAAFGAIGPFLTALMLIPAGLALIYLAWATWSQRSWAWMANLGSLALFAFLALRQFSSAPLLALFWLFVAGALTVIWLRPETKVWYGLS